MRILSFCAALLAISLGARAQSPESERWIDSPEAYFATNEERAEWDKLRSRRERNAFKERYWLRRDPTAGTETNEFRDVVLGRIKTADARFPMGDTPGSRTARGFVFIVFGSPARVSSDYAPPLTPPRTPVPGAPPGPPVGLHEGNEVRESWIYDLQRTPRVLQALSRPSLEMTFIVEPTRRRDRLQNPGLAYEYRDELAKKSIVNESLVTAIRTPPQPPPRFAPVVASVSEVRAALATESGGIGATFGHLLLWPEANGASVIVWFAVPPRPEEELSHTELVAAIRSGHSTQYFSAPAISSPHFFTNRPTSVLAAQLDVPPGNHGATFALISKGRVVATANSSLQIPDLTKDFSVSSIVLTGGANPAIGDEKSPFRLGTALLQPRADSTYLRAESLWYFFEVANPSDAGRVTVKTLLRRPGAPLAGSGPKLAQLQQVAPGRYVSGFEIPLSDLEPGEYSLYATFVDPESGAEVLKRADFRILPD